MKGTTFLVLVLLLLSACHAKDNSATPTDAAEVSTPVTVTSINRDTLNDYIELNATSTYLQVNIIKSQTAGYLKQVNIHAGEKVNAGTVAFVLRTKESQALGNTINSLDPSFRFSGLINIHADVTGYVQQLNYHAGDYVQDGEPLATITDGNSFAFVMNVPFELRQLIKPQQLVNISLPDGTHLDGRLASILPAVDSVSQSMQVRINVVSGAYIPQNVIGKVRIQKTNKPDAVTLPRQAILSDEAQQEFWVMKMIDSVTAIKVPVTKGMEIDGRVEIIAPAFAATDKIVTVGNYGLADTAKVKIMEVLK